MANEKRPTYLKPVPSGQTAAAAVEAPAEVPADVPEVPADVAEVPGAPSVDAAQVPAGEAVLGLSPPLRRGHSGMFITDVICELGYARQERVDQVIAEARTAGRSPERLMLEEGVISTDPDFTDGWYAGLNKGKYATWITAAWGPASAS